MWSNILFSGFLIVLAASLLISHASAWRNTRESEPDEKALDFHRRQFRRRMQAGTAMLGIVGLGIAGGLWIDAQDDTILSVTYWGAILLIVAWIAVLAAADWVASRFYYHLIHTDQQSEHAAIQAELDRIRSREGNGRDHS